MLDLKKIQQNVERNVRRWDTISSILFPTSVENTWKKYWVDIRINFNEEILICWKNYPYRRSYQYAKKNAGWKNIWHVSTNLVLSRNIYIDGTQKQTHITAVYWMTLVTSRWCWNRNSGMYYEKAVCPAHLFTHLLTPHTSLLSARPISYVLNSKIQKP